MRSRALRAALLLTCLGVSLLRTMLGNLSMTDLYATSLNTGTATIGQSLGAFRQGKQYDSGGNNNNNPQITCLVHTPIQAGFKNVIKHAINQTQALQLPSPEICGQLRRNWHHVSLQSDLARQMEAHQTNCHLPVATFEMDNRYGIGSTLHVWSQALCNAMEQGYRLCSDNPELPWLDKVHCDVETEAQLSSPLLCYFPKAEYRCDRHDDIQLILQHKVTLRNEQLRDRNKGCQLFKDLQQRGEAQALRRAATEYLFQSVSDLVIQEANRQIGLIFGEAAPNDLITVHIRWGDKSYEMKVSRNVASVKMEHLQRLNQNRDSCRKLVRIPAYIDAVTQILEARGGQKPVHETAANIYLATEDPKAVNMFRSAAPTSWNVFVDRSTTELVEHRPRRKALNHALYTTFNTQGRAGLVALGSLLVAMEAKDFVLTTASGWSRLMDELRRNVLDPQCGNCTSMIDLRPGAW